MTDLELLGSLGVIRSGKLTKASLLLAGREAGIRQHLPHYLVSHFRMTSDVAYSDQSQGSEAIPVAPELRLLLVEPAAPTAWMWVDNCNEFAGVRIFPVLMYHPLQQLFCLAMEKPKYGRIKINQFSKELTREYRRSAFRAASSGQTIC